MDKRIETITQYQVRSKVIIYLIILLLIIMALAVMNLAQRLNQFDSYSGFNSDTFLTPTSAPNLVK